MKKPYRPSVQWIGPLDAPRARQPTDAKTHASQAAPWPSRKARGLDITSFQAPRFVACMSMIVVASGPQVAISPDFVHSMTTAQRPDVTSNAY